MTVRDVMMKIDEIDALCDLWRKDALQKADIARAVELLEEYRQTLAGRKVVG